MSRRYKGAILSANATSSSLPVSGLWTIDQQYNAKGAGLWPLAPSTPTIGTATAGNNVCAVVSFTAGCTGYPLPVTYTVTSTPGSITARGSGSPIRVTGLTVGTAYTFKVKANNSTGFSACSAASNSITAVSIGQTAYTTTGCYSFIVPAGVTSISAVTVGGGGGGGGADGGGGGGGGALAYANNITVSPGATVSVTVGRGGDGGPPNGYSTPTGSGFSRVVYAGTTRAQANGGGFSYYGGAGGGNVATGTGGSGGTGGYGYAGGGGGGGAGGYSGTGGTGGNFNGGGGSAGSGGAGAGGGGGGYCYFVVNCCVFFEYWFGGGGGGGVSILGLGGACAIYGGGGGGGGMDASFYINPGNRPQKEGGGGGGGGAVRIIWPGNTRSFPSTNAGNL